METSEPYRRTPEDLAIKAQQENLHFNNLVESVSENTIRLFLKNTPDLSEKLALLGEYPAERSEYIKLAEKVGLGTPEVVAVHKYLQDLEEGKILN